MSIITGPQDFNTESLFVDLKTSLGTDLYLKVEGLNFAGSVKLKAATAMVEAAERDGILTPDSTIVESSSGNLGVALAMITAAKGYRFICVTDSRCNLTTRRMIEALGSEVHVITEPHPDNGLLGARLDHVRELCDTDAHHIWLNQYSNENSWKAHYTTTGPEIAAEFPHLDVLFVGAGTTGTLMGCARYFTDHHPDVTIVAVDSVGSVTFGHQPARRMIPGLGSGIRPPMLDDTLIDDVVLVDEADTVRTCHRLARTGFLFGGSTGTVVTGAEAWLAEHGTPGMTAVTIAPDLGERYLDTIYQQHWVEDLYGDDALTTDELIAA